MSRPASARHKQTLALDRRSRMSSFSDKYGYKRPCQAWYRITIKCMRDLSVFLLHSESIDWGRETTNRHIRLAGSAPFLALPYLMLHCRLVDSLKVRSPSIIVIPALCPLTSDSPAPMIGRTQFV
ncbi:unnamed protein product [Clonostachys rosea]|uniref:Uncharacterized protein n=1 Tax=Bionectria ochroleuca TaxID=29856 RepID=A0ABY6UF07_BIOOC|nr:unnamed protein product [Clonostachys rosea]